jgi:hypothetical protein
MKSIMLLTVALFSISAPSPELNTLSELAGGFLLVTPSGPILAAESTSHNTKTGCNTPAQ